MLRASALLPEQHSDYNLGYGTHGNRTHLDRSQRYLVHSSCIRARLFLAACHRSRWSRARGPHHARDRRRARDMHDAALLTDLMAGADPRDPATLNRPLFQWTAPDNSAKPLAGIRIAMIPPAQYPIAMGADVLRLLDDTRRVLVDLGATQAAWFWGNAIGLAVHERALAGEEGGLEPEAALGALGGRKKSPRKAAAARLNGKRGGRPRKERPVEMAVAST